MKHTTDITENVTLTRKEFETLLDWTWVLFTNLKDRENDEDLVDAVLYFHKQHDFNLEELPDSLLYRVEGILEQESKELE